MFKKRTRPASVREKPAVVEEPPKADGEDGDEVEEAGDEESGLDMEELRLLRKLKKSKQGIDLEKLNRGEVKKNSKKKDQDEIQGYGLQGSSRKDDGGDDDLQGEEGRVKKLVRSNNFTQQTNALDVDKHMLAYIEGEMEKRRGMNAPEATKPEPFDPQAELYKISDKYNVQARKIKEAEEGNVTNSLGMLTSIPEVDLGMDNRLRNIEETERAKREMMEERKAASDAKGPREEDYSAARFYRPNQRVASDIYAIEDARRAAAGGGIPAEPRPPRQDRVDRHESATDEQVYDRFKKRMKR